ncbi:MAG: hypothetical protein M3O70_08940 [Actinomycetota bacterium]|nr:hypothetical protein [Actinomycetota bacterium]
MTDAPVRDLVLEHLLHLSESVGRVEQNVLRVEDKVDRLSPLDGRIRRLEVWAVSATATAAAAGVGHFGPGVLTGLIALVAGVLP